MSGSSRRISLVLGSGGARGLAHIGVINWLEENGHEIVSVSGSSVGALIGGIYAIGKLEEYERWVTAITATDMLKLVDLNFGRDGLMRGKKIIGTLKELIGDCDIGDLPISFTAVASDLESEKEVWINSGSLFDAIRASISLPLFFTPVATNGMLLLDGGVLNPVPIAPTFNDDSDFTVAVNLGGKPDPKFNPARRKAPPKQKDDDFTRKIAEFIRNLDIVNSNNEERIGFMDIVDRTFDTMQSAIARQQLAAYPPDYEIEIPNNVCGMLEFDRAEEMIALGYDKASEALAQL